MGQGGWESTAEGGRGIAAQRQRTMVLAAISYNVWRAVRDVNSLPLKLHSEPVTLLLRGGRQGERKEAGQGFFLQKQICDLTLLGTDTMRLVVAELAAV